MEHVYHTPFSQGSGIFMEEGAEGLHGLEVACDLWETVSSRHNKLHSTRSIFIQEYMDSTNST